MKISSSPNASLSYWNPVVGLARSLLAFSLLLNLLGHSSSDLFSTINGLPVGALGEPVQPSSLNFFWLAGSNGVQVWTWISIVLLFICLIGWLPRWTAPFHAWIAWSYHEIGTLVDGGDKIAAVLAMWLLPLVLLDSRKNHFAKASYAHIPWQNTVAWCCTLAIQWQMLVLYFDAAFAKWSVPEWSDGTALYYWSQDTFFGYPDWLLAITVPILIIPSVGWLLGWAAVAMEFALGAGIFLAQNSRWRALLLGLGFCFHGTLALMHGIVSFFFAICAGLILSLGYDWSIKNGE